MTDDCKKLVIAADHAGYRLKEYLHHVAEDMGWEVVDLGTTSEQSVDYPDYTASLVQYIKNNPAFLGLIICGTGIGMSIAANRFPHIRAALCHSEFEAEVARSHNNANVLCLGGRVIGEELAKSIMVKFLNASFEGGRHQRRLDKIDRLKAQCE
ncbi:MAG TPA: ribose 5-phosphate isomerase B [Candidatus Nitrosotenuis sp.]|jgi:ribose 5-phosphate isomerase B|nr:ribose 5-phosphate isomerase B [Candidatus Nitrosotenuis sp.]